MLLPLARLRRLLQPPGELPPWGHIHHPLPLEGAPQASKEQYSPGGHLCGHVFLQVRVESRGVRGRMGLNVRQEVLPRLAGRRERGTQGCFPRQHVLLAPLRGRSGSSVINLGEKALLRAPSDHTSARRAAFPEVIQSRSHKPPPPAVQ